MTPVWIDALCVDQSNLDERSAQVAMMMSIYAQAECVHLWLGNETGPPTRAIVALEEAVADSAPEIWFQKSVEHAAEKLACLCEMSRNPYWQRTWTLQEVSFARIVVIHARESWVDLRPPRRDMDYNAMMELHGRFLGVSNSVSARLAGCTDPKSPLYPSRHILGLAVLVEHMLDVFVRVNWSWRMQLVNQKHRLDGGLGAGAFDFPQLDLFTVFRTTLSTDPKDKIYGLLGFVTSFHDIQPDYSKSTKEIYCSATMRLMRDTGDLSYLNQACSNNLDLPSWVPDYRSPCKWKGMAIVDWKAHATSGADSFFDMDENNQLLVRGLIFDCVTVIHQDNDFDLGDGNVLHQAWHKWLSFHPTLFGKTVNHRGQIATRLSDFYTYVLNTKGDQTHERCIDWINSLSEPSGQIPHEFMSMIAQMIGQYEIFSSAKGYCGIAPRGLVSAGNSIAIIAGARVPFCITFHPPSHNRKMLRLRAACLLEGDSGRTCSVMYGAVADSEAMRRFNDPSRINEIFEEMTII